MCIPHFSRFQTAFDGRRSTQAWLQNLAPFQVFINTSVIQDKTLTIYINDGKFKLEKAPNFVTRPASNVYRRTLFGREKKCGVHISVKCVVIKVFIPTYIPSNKLRGFKHILDIYSTKVVVMLVGRR